jgi:hypothetical protein
MKKKRARRAHRERQRDTYSGSHRRWFFEGYNANDSNAWRMLWVPQILKPGIALFSFGHVVATPTAFAAEPNLG